MLNSFFFRYMLSPFIWAPFILNPYMLSPNVFNVSYSFVLSLSFINTLCIFSHILTVHYFSVHIYCVPILRRYLSSFHWQQRIMISFFSADGWWRSDSQSISLVAGRIHRKCIDGRRIIAECAIKKKTTTKETSAATIRFETSKFVSIYVICSRLFVSIERIISKRSDFIDFAEN